MQEEYLTTDEAADRLRVSEETVRRWCRTGQLGAIKIGRAYRIALSAVLASVDWPSEAGPVAYGQPTDPPTPPAAPTPPGRDELELEPLPDGWTRADPMPDEWGRGYRGRVVIIQ